MQWLKKSEDNIDAMSQRKRRIKTKIFSPLSPIVSMMDTSKNISTHRETNIGRGQNISFIGNEKF